MKFSSTEITRLKIRPLPLSHSRVTGVLVVRVSPSTKRHSLLGSMNEERLLKVLLAPHVSEKSTLAAETNNTVVFKVVKDANKAEIKAAVEKLFEVEVNSVRTVNCKGKTKRHGQSFGKRSDWKKAYVVLKEGQDIDFVGAGE